MNRRRFEKIKTDRFLFRIPGPRKNTISPKSLNYENNTILPSLLRVYNIFRRGGVDAGRRVHGISSPSKSPNKLSIVKVITNFSVFHDIILQ